MKKLKVNQILNQLGRKAKLTLLTTSVAVGLTACGVETPDVYSTDDYYVVYADGNPYFVYMEANLMAIITNIGTANLYDVNNQKLVAKFSNCWETEKQDVFSNDTIPYITRYALIPLNEMIDKDTISKETYQFFASGGEEIDEYIEENYPYNVTFYQECDDKVYETDLGIYEFINELNGEKNYHLGYNANRVYECNYIYDIKDGKVYRKPDVGTVEFTPIRDLYDEDNITVNQASELMNNYIAQKEEDISFQKSK